MITYLLENLFLVKLPIAPLLMGVSKYFMNAPKFNVKADKK